MVDDVKVGHQNKSKSEIEKLIYDLTLQMAYYKKDDPNISKLQSKINELKSIAEKK